MKINRRRFLKQSLCAATTAPIQHSLAAGSNTHKSQVLIIGAGLAGLNTARLLEQQGLDVTVLEAKSGAGGRTLSMSAGDQQINMGGVEIGDRYDRFISLAKKHNLTLQAADASQPGLSLFRQGSLFNAKDWAASAKNPLSEPLNSLLPNRLQFGLHARSLPFATTSDWLDPKFAELDIPESERLIELGADNAALALINRTGNFNQIDEVSSIHVMRALANYKFGNSKSTLRLQGGNDQLAIHMAGALNDVRFNHAVTRIEQAGTEAESSLTIHCNNGQRFMAQKLVIAIPFSVLRRIDLQLNLTSAHKTAIEKLPYTKISKMVARVERPFWEQDGLPANLWCDSALERCFLTFDSDGTASYTFFVNGVGTQALDQLEPKQAQQWLLNELQKVRPSTHGALTPLAYHSWGNDPFALGAYAAFGPGQVTAFARQMVAPAGHVYFAGEHCSRSSSGMEGALESAEITARQILENT